MTEGIALGRGYPAPPGGMLFPTSQRTGGSCDLRGIWRATEPHPTAHGTGGRGQEHSRPGARLGAGAHCKQPVSLNLSNTR